MRAETLDRHVELVSQLQRRGLLGLVESAASRHHVSLRELLWERGYVHVRARRDAWAALHDCLRSYSEIGRLFQLGPSTIRMGVEAHLREKSRICSRRATSPFPSEGGSSCDGREQKAAEWASPECEHDSPVAQCG